MSIFLTKCLLYPKKSSPEASKMIYEDIPYQMSLKSLRKVDHEIQGGYRIIFLTKILSIFWEK